MGVECDVGGNGTADNDLAAASRKPTDKCVVVERRCFAEPSSLVAGMVKLSLVNIIVFGEIKVPPHESKVIVLILFAFTQTILLPTSCDLYVVFSKF